VAGFSRHSHGVRRAHEWRGRRQRCLGGDSVDSEEVATRPCPAGYGCRDLENPPRFFTHTSSLARSNPKSPFHIKGFQLAKSRPNTGSTSSRWTILIASILIRASQPSEQSLTYDSASTKVLRHIPHHPNDLSWPIRHRSCTTGMGTSRPCKTWPGRRESPPEHHSSPQCHRRPRWFLLNIPRSSGGEQQPGYRPPA